MGGENVSEEEACTCVYHSMMCACMRAACVRVRVYCTGCRPPPHLIPMANDKRDLRLRFAKPRARFPKVRLHDLKGVRPAETDVSNIANLGPPHAVPLRWHLRFG